MIKPPATPSAASRFFTGLFFSVFLLSGLGFGYFLAVRPLAQSINARSWTETSCVILSSEVKEHSDSDGSTYSPEISYQYRFEGRLYHGDRYQFLRVSSSGRADKQAVVSRYPRGSKALCYVNPNNPSQAVLNRQYTPSWFMLFPLVFIAVGAGGIYWIIFGGKAAPLPVQATPDQPWLMRADWQTGRIASSTKTTLRMTWIFAIFWNLISTPLAGAFLSQERLHQGPATLFVLIFPLVGLGFLIWAIRLTLRSLRFGEPVFEMTHLPAAIGGAVEGWIRFTKPVRLDTPAKLKLACLTRSSSSDSTSENVLWQHESIAHPLEGEGVIPVCLRVPEDAQETSTLGAADGIIWRLSTTGNSSGAKYEASFDVPVFRVALSPEQTAKARTLLSQEKTNLAAYTQPSSSLIRVQPAMGGGVEFFFPPRRNLASTLFGSLVGLAFVALFLGIAHKADKADAPLFVEGIFSLFAAVFLYTLIHGLTASKRMIIQREGVLATSTIAGIATTCQIPAHEIVTIRPKAGMQIGSTVFQNLKVIRTNGKEIDVSGPIKDCQEAEWLAAEMLKPLGRQI